MALNKLGWIDQRVRRHMPSLKIALSMRKNTSNIAKSSRGQRGCNSSVYNAVRVLSNSWASPKSPNNAMFGDR
jgi:hypothetical protein